MHMNHHKKIMSLSIIVSEIEGGGALRDFFLSIYSVYIFLQVALRIRPISTKESREGCQTALELIPNEPQVMIANSNKCFTYDYAFDGESEQVQIYSQERYAI